MTQAVRVWSGIQEGLVPRAAINAKTAPRDPYDPLPANVGHGNFMIANWAVGKEADPFQVGQKLKVSPFDCIVITMTTAVTETSLIAKFFS